MSSSDKPSSGDGERAHIDAAGAPPQDVEGEQTAALTRQGEQAPAFTLQGTMVQMQAQVDASLTAMQAQMDAQAAQVGSLMEQVAAMALRLNGIVSSVNKTHVAAYGSGLIVAPAGASNAPHAQPDAPLAQPHAALAQPHAPLAHHDEPDVPPPQPPYDLLGEYDPGQSALEAVLSAGWGELARPILSFLTQEEARSLRTASSVCCKAVAEHAWAESSSWISGSLALWRRCFPRATFANVSEHPTITDADMVHLSGIHTLLMSKCSEITDAGLAHLRGIHTLNISRSAASLRTRASHT